jgi:dihydroorotate dehydrogenase electron transfer subunit
MNDERMEIIGAEPVSTDSYRVTLQAHIGYADARPGQFVMVRIPDGLTPLLRRPFSIHRSRRLSASQAALEILYRVVGKGTRRLAGCRPGDRLDVLGPLGRGFSAPPPSGPLFLAAGGMGVAPMVFLADRLCLDENRRRDIRVFLGGRTAEELLCRDRFEELGLPVVLTTDDGSDGDQCLVTHPIEEQIRLTPPAMIYACGPPGMLSCIVGFADTYGIRVEVSIETLMACGLGACLACAVADRRDPQRYRHACLHGPVFDSREILLP